MPGQLRHVTQNQIARSLGLSQETVSQVLRGVGRASTETREKVLSAVKELGYQRNGPARAIRIRRFGSISIVKSDISNLCFLPESFMQALAPMLREHGLNLNMTYLPKAPGELLKFRFDRLMVDGLLLNLSENAPPGTMEAVNESGIPHVWFNAKMPSDCVYPDDRKASFDLVKLLCSKGLKNIIYIEACEPPVLPSPHYSELDRKQGYLEGMAAAGLRPIFVKVSELGTDWFRNMDARSLSSAAVVAYGGRAALKCLLVLKELGGDVASNVSIAYFGTAPFYIDELDRRLWLLRVPFRELAEVSFKMLLSKINGDGGPCPPFAIPYLEKDFAWEF